MSDIKIELNSDGVKALLKSDEMMDVCEQYANKALNKLGNGYEKSTHIGKKRVNVSVVATTKEAIKENQKNNTVLKAVL